MSWQTVSDLISTGCLAMLAGACLVHLNAHVTRESSHCERIGFALVIGGAIGQAASYWWPRAELWPVDVVLHLGLTFVALAMIRGDLRNLLARLRGWDGIDRRSGRDDGRFDGTLGA